MQTLIKIIFLFLLIGSTAIAQSPRYLALGKLKAATSKPRIQTAIQLQDLSPDFWQHLAMPYELRIELDKRRLLASVEGYYVFPPDKNLGKYITITAATITAIHDGKPVYAFAENADINSDHRKILARADIGSDIVIRVTFADPRQAGDDGLPKKIVEAQVNIHVVPEREAEFPGGESALTSYLFKHIVSKYADGIAYTRLSKALVVFTVDENGSVQNVQLRSSSGDKKTDSTILNAIQQMPGWQPAEENNKKVKQEFIVPFNSDGC